MGSIKKELEEGYLPSGGYKNTARELRMKDNANRGSRVTGIQVGDALRRLATI